MLNEVEKPKLSPLDLAVLSAKLIRKNYAKILPIALLVAIPTSILNLVSTFIVIEGLKSSTTYSQFTGDLMSVLFMVILILPFIIFLAVLMSGAMVKMVYELVNGREYTLKQALQFGLDKWVPVFITQLIMGIFLFGLTLLLIVPGIIFSVLWIFALPVVILEDKVDMAALKQSRALVSGRWWRTLGYILSLVLILIVVTFPFAIVSELIFPSNPSTSLGVTGYLRMISNIPLTTLLAAELFQLLGTLLATSLSLTYSVFMYLNWKKNPVVAHVENE